jgi:hypothetical protein
MMEIFVGTMTGKTVVLQVESSDTIEMVKTKFFAKEGIDPKWQTLLYAGKTLEDNKTLEDYKVQAGTKIHNVTKSLFVLDKSNGLGDDDVIKIEDHHIRYFLTEQFMMLHIVAFDRRDDKKGDDDKDDDDDDDDDNDKDDDDNDDDDNDNDDKDDDDDDDDDDDNDDDDGDGDDDGKNDKDDGKDDKDDDDDDDCKSTSNTPTASLPDLAHVAGSSSTSEPGDVTTNTSDAAKCPVFVDLTNEEPAMKRVCTNDTL